MLPDLPEEEQKAGTRNGRQKDDSGTAQIYHSNCKSRIYERGSKSLYISQPSLSTAIRELETETGVEIFRRTNRGIAVTPAGEEFLGYARQVVEQYELMEAKYISRNSHAKIQCFHAALYLCS